MEDEPYPAPSTEPSLERNLHSRPDVRTELDEAPRGGDSRPGSDGEHEIQRQIGSTARADRFYDNQMLDHLNANMREFVAAQEMFFLATSDAKGECDNTFRAGPPGFLRVLDERTLVFPEYRGNGVHASLGNMRENPHLGILLVDFVRARIGLHVNGRARILTDANIRAAHPDLPKETVPGRRAELWVQIDVEEAYIHCAKHIPQLQKAPRGTPRDWGTDDPSRKGGDYFGVARDRVAARRDEVRVDRAHEVAGRPHEARASRPDEGAAGADCAARRAADERSAALSRLRVRRTARLAGTGEPAGTGAPETQAPAGPTVSGTGSAPALRTGPVRIAKRPGVGQPPPSPSAPVRTSLVPPQRPAAPPRPPVVPPVVPPPVGGQVGAGGPESAVYSPPSGFAPPPPTSPAPTDTRATGEPEPIPPQSALEWRQEARGVLAEESQPQAQAFQGWFSPSD